MQRGSTTVWIRGQTDNNVTSTAGAAKTTTRNDESKVNLVEWTPRFGNAFSII